MSRNSETIFSNLPSINIQRSIMDIPQDHKTTFNVGELIPFYLAECLPSDSVKIVTNKVVRLQTLLTPLMSELVLDTFYFFVPNRLVWNHWKEFMGENTASAYLPEITYRPPRIICGGETYGAVSSGDILDYMGLPLVSASASAGYYSIAFPLRGYWMIWNEFFRDQNLQDPINIPLGDSDVSWKNVSAILKKPLPVNRLHDYFSSALKAPAKNDNGFVTAWSSRQRITQDSPFYTSTADHHYSFSPVYQGSTILDVTGQVPAHMTAKQNDTVSKATLTVPGNTFGDTYTDNTLLGYKAATASGTNGVKFDNLYTDLYYNQFGITIPDLRQAFQMQKFLEREASHGSRYQEVLLAHFSTKAMDARLQRPEYLGGNRIPLNISQVVNQSQSSGEYLGDVGALSLTTDSHFDVEYSCQEHGWIIGLCAVRYKSSYSQGYNRQFNKTTRYDYAWPEFSHLTDQSILNNELYFDESDFDYNGGIFGYQERYAEYKYAPDRVSGEMRPGITNSLASWHLGDYYTSQVFLSDGWLQMSKAPVDRALAVTSSTSNQVFADFYMQARWTRPLPVHSNPGFADHF